MDGDCLQATPYDTKTVILLAQVTNIEDNLSTTLDFMLHAHKIPIERKSKGTNPEFEEYMLVESKANLHLIDLLKSIFELSNNLVSNNYTNTHQY